MTEKLYTFAEMEFMIKQLRHEMKQSTIDPKPMIEYFNKAKVISTTKQEADGDAI